MRSAHLAALAWVERLSFTADTLLEDVLEHEERFWRTQANALQDAIGEEVFIEQVRSAVAAMTIASKDAGKGFLRRVNDNGDERLLLFLRRPYPGTALTYTSPLEPDLLGEGKQRFAQFEPLHA